MVIMGGYQNSYSYKNTNERRFNDQCANICSKLPSLPNCVSWEIEIYIINILQNNFDLFRQVKLRRLA